MLLLVSMMFLCLLHQNVKSMTTETGSFHSLLCPDPLGQFLNVRNADSGGWLILRCGAVPGSSIPGIHPLHDRGAIKTIFWGSGVPWGAKLHPLELRAGAQGKFSARVCGSCHK